MVANGTKLWGKLDIYERRKSNKYCFLTMETGKIGGGGGKERLREMESDKFFVEGWGKIED